MNLWLFKYVGLDRTFICFSFEDAQVQTMVFMIVWWNILAGFSLKIESLYFVLLQFQWEPILMATDIHGVATCDFATLSGCNQLVHYSTHRGGGILDLVMSDVPDLCKEWVGCPIERSDHSHDGIELDLSFGAPGFDFSQEVFLNSRVNCRAVCLDVTQCTDTLGYHCSQSCYG